MREKSRKSSRTTPASKARNRALHVLARMRRTGATLSAAARERAHRRANCQKVCRPRAQAVKNWRQSAQQSRPATSGNADSHVARTTPVSIRGSRQASLLGKYMVAVGKYLRTGDADALEEFEGRSIAGHRLITDLTR